MANLILYDGVCGLCNRLVRFVLARDWRDEFRFAALQGQLARKLLGKYSRDPDDLDTFYLIMDYGQPTERLMSKGRGILFLLRRLGGGWLCATPFAILPTRWLDAAYDFIAKRRYRLFGKSEHCVLPDPHQRAKFLDEVS